MHVGAIAAFGGVVYASRWPRSGSASLVVFSSAEPEPRLGVAAEPLVDDGVLQRHAVHNDRAVVAVPRSVDSDAGEALGAGDRAVVEVRPAPHRLRDGDDAR